LSGAGKSTLAYALERELFDQGKQPVVLDGDAIRHGLSTDLGFSAADRAENIRRVAETAKLFAEAGFVAITALISPYRSDRARARQIIQGAGGNVPFIEVYLNTPINICEARDPKHLYARAKRGEIPEFTGISAPFEPSDRAELVIDTSVLSLDHSLGRLLSFLTPTINL
jgi:adenylyl-sulfate kinase